MKFREVVEGLQAGDFRTRERSYALIFNDFTDIASAMLRYARLPKDDVKDIIQLAFIGFYDYRMKNPFDLSQPEALLRGEFEVEVRRLVKWKRGDYFKRLTRDRNRSVKRDEVEVADFTRKQFLEGVDGTTAENILLEREAFEIIVRALEALSDDEQNQFILFYQNGLHYADLGEKIGVGLKSSTMRKRMQRVKEKVIEHIKLFLLDDYAQRRGSGIEPSIADMLETAYFYHTGFLQSDLKALFQDALREEKANFDWARIYQETVISICNENKSDIHFLALKRYVNGVTYSRLAREHDIKLIRLKSKVDKGLHAFQRRLGGTA